MTSVLNSTRGSVGNWWKEEILAISEELFMLFTWVACPLAYLMFGVMEQA